MTTAIAYTVRAFRKRHTWQIAATAQAAPYDTLAEQVPFPCPAQRNRARQILDGIVTPSPLTDDQWAAAWAYITRSRTPDRLYLDTTDLATYITSQTAPPPGPTTILEDAFTDADGTGLSAHTIYPTRPGTAAWTNPSNAYEIRSNRARAKTPISYIPVVNAGYSDCELTALIHPASSTSRPGLALRYTSGTYYLARHHPPSQQLQLYLLPSPGLLAYASLNHTGDHTLRVRLNGSTIDVSVDGQSPTIHYTSATTNQSSTTHGLYNYLDGDAWDDFTIKTLT